MSRSRKRPPAAARQPIDRRPSNGHPARPATRSVHRRGSDRGDRSADARLHRAERLGHRVTAAPAGAVQAQLTVGPVDDAHEREADQVAREVMQRLDRGTDAGAGEAGGGAVQRMEGELDEDEVGRMADDEIGRMAEDEDEIGRAAAPMLDDDEPDVQTKPLARAVAAGSGPQGGALDADVAGSIDQARSGGQPLDDGVRGDMESAFDTDFSGVRVHDDTRADGLNRSLQARAFTTGNDVFFSQGTYRPGTADGRELLAHELTHVVQQTGAGPRGDES